MLVYDICAFIVDFKYLLEEVYKFSWFFAKSYKLYLGSN